MDLLSRGTRWFLFVVLALAALSGCSPPPELAGRPPSPVDVAAASLLPAGKVVRSNWLASSDSAEAIISEVERFRAARFATAAEAHRAFLDMRTTMALRPEATSTSSVDVGALQYLRYGAEDVSGLIWVSGTWLFWVEAKDTAALARLIAASGAGGVGDPGLAGSPLAMAALFALAGATIVLLILLLLWLIVRSLAVRPSAGTPVLNRDQLIRRLTSLNDPARPWVVRTGPEADLVVEWKYADASWWGVLGKAGLKRAYRLRLYLDETRKRCGALDEFGEVDWSAGLMAAPGVHFRKSFFRGIQLANVERGVVYGLRSPTGGIGKVVDYSFNIDEIKRPVIDAVSAAGWTYQPILRPH